MKHALPLTALSTVQSSGSATRDEASKMPWVSKNFDAIDTARKGVRTTGSPAMNLIHRLLLSALWLVTATVATAAIASPPIGVHRIDDLRYGDDPRQAVDVFLPATPHRAPVMVMVHGGAWMVGDKSMGRVVDAKVAHWVQASGFILVSVNYRLVPQVDPRTQAQDVARAIATVQARAAEWGGDPDKLVLMGHSAGAHLVALLSADPALAMQQGASPWRGTVVLDSAALDTVGLMQRRHARFYDRVFGTDPTGWRAVSPTAQLGRSALPMLVVCSTQRADRSCEQSQDFVGRVQAGGGRAQLLPQDLSHAEVNAALGQPGRYTDAVDAFIASVHAAP